MNVLRLFIIFLVLFFFNHCSDYQKLLNSDNTAEKYKSAELFYNSGEYRKASRLFEQILPKYRGKPQAQRLIFFHADSYFLDKNYQLSANQFQNFIKSYPKSNRLIEAHFKEAKSYYYQSPKYSLDQEDTFNAIEKLQIFINNYQESEFSDQANQLIIELQTKLEQKDFETAKQYFTIRDYKASIRANNNFLASYPGTKFREESLYFKFIALFEIAINSIQSKKTERMNGIKKHYEFILKNYPETLYLSKLNKKMQLVQEELELSNINNSLTK